MRNMLPLALACITTGVHASPTLYGKANLTYSQVTEQTADSETSLMEVASNASRLGVKGSESLPQGFEVIYQAEYEIAFDDGDTLDNRDKSDTKPARTLSQRDIFIGLKGNFGTLMAGHFDTPLKKSQNKIDLFNDLYGDYKFLSLSENRVSNSFQYQSPSLAGFVFSADLVNAEYNRESTPKKRALGHSTSASYEKNGLWLALAHDKHVKTENSETTRLVAQYSLSNWQFGLLTEQYEIETLDKRSSETAVLGSVQYSLQNWAFKLQYGDSDIPKPGSETLSIGFDHNLSKTTKWFAFYTQNGYDIAAVAAKPATASSVAVDAKPASDYTADYAGVGISLSF